MPRPTTSARARCSRRSTIAPPAPPWPSNARCSRSTAAAATSVSAPRSQQAAGLGGTAATCGAAGRLGHRRAGAALALRRRGLRRRCRAWDGSAQAPHAEIEDCWAPRRSWHAALRHARRGFIAHRARLPETARARSIACRASGCRAPRAGSRWRRRVSGSRAAPKSLGVAALRPDARRTAAAAAAARSDVAGADERGGWRRGAGEVPRARHLPSSARPRRSADRGAGAPAPGHACLLAQWRTVRTLARAASAQGCQHACGPARPPSACAARACARCRCFPPWTIGGSGAIVNRKAERALERDAGAAVATGRDPGRLWLLLVMILGAGWVALVISQARQISATRRPLAGSADSAGATRNGPARGGADRRRIRVFLLLLLTRVRRCCWFYWRDMRRARGTQAFFAALTHELRTPLTSVRLQSEAIAEGEPSAELAERLLEDTHRLESQIDKTLELARIEGGGALAEQAIRLHGLARAHRGRNRRGATVAGSRRACDGRARPCRRSRRHRGAADDPAQPGRELRAPR